MQVPAEAQAAITTERWAQLEAMVGSNFAGMKSDVAALRHAATELGVQAKLVEDGDCTVLQGSIRYSVKKHKRQMVLAARKTPEKKVHPTSLARASKKRASPAATRTALTTPTKRQKTTDGSSKAELPAGFFGPFKFPALPGGAPTGLMPTSFRLGEDPALTWTVFGRHVEFKDGLAALILAKTSMAPECVIPHQRSSLMGDSFLVVWKSKDDAALAFKQLLPECPENPCVCYYEKVKSL
ncbi:hypothetical protein SDRG_02329 [Saprolegnia diclina VS20]|uniref:Uncharacterized protein n=1 Tax=Saprolegnia diclina (strain VS20) TaxID=1156394 RepID=T0S5G6_SAPDV|nr:hypothetical protein SDRG_02329 [Saprolegnia diclina VS20]EQC40433.1 hypothetical protein SDRG_02329 [Saprolegnia diclina VS20]|eukprot:XP_008606132.1 hypothetical protein SDRG_02329 [Saprolegnia diclina VS20]